MPQVTMDKTFNQAFKIAGRCADQFDVPDEIRNNPDLYVSSRPGYPPSLLRRRPSGSARRCRITAARRRSRRATSCSSGPGPVPRCAREPASRQARDRGQPARGRRDRGAHGQTWLKQRLRICINASDSAQNRRDCNRLRADAVRNGQTEGRERAEAAARHLLNAQLRAFYFPDLIRLRMRV